MEDDDSDTSDINDEEESIDYISENNGSTYTWCSKDTATYSDSDKSDDISDDEINGLHDDLLNECYTLGYGFRTN